MGGSDAGRDRIRRQEWVPYQEGPFEKQEMAMDQ